jgi:hypothetical protein
LEVKYGASFVGFQKKQEVMNVIPLNKEIKRILTIKQPIGVVT